VPRHLPAGHRLLARRRLLGRRGPRAADLGYNPGSYHPGIRAFYPRADELVVIALGTYPPAAWDDAVFEAAVLETVRRAASGERIFGR
jgi:hypothetical protein